MICIGKDSNQVGTKKRFINRTLFVDDKSVLSIGGRGVSKKYYAR